MKMKVEDLQPITMPLFGFSRHTVQPLKQIELHVSLGYESRQKIIMTTFTVVDASSAYNIILGHSSLSAF